VLEALDVVAVELAEGLPVEVAKLVAGRVLLVLGELHALALMRALVQPGEHALHHRPGAQLHPGQLGERGRIERFHRRVLGLALHQFQDLLDDPLAGDALALRG
jgi:hypothetical protein